MIQRRTQSASYWQEQFSVTQKDMSQLYGLILDAARPVDTATLSKALIERHCRQEEELIRAELSKGRVYQPKDEYEVGEPIIFPVFDYALATVVGTRQGRNPEYGEFTVIQVEFEEDGEVREFASQLVGEHRQNREDGGQEVATPDDLLEAAELYERYGEQVEDKLLSSLEQHGDFLEVRGQWFLKDLLAGVDLGRRNIAEALIEIRSMPLPPGEILTQLDLPREVPEEVRTFSLNYALAQDERFDNVGDHGRDIWYLKRLTPKEVVNPPERLAIERVAHKRQDIAEELLLIEREIDDEGSGEQVMGPSRPLYRTTISLIYPHWRCGTLPLTVRTRGLFPQSENHHTPVILVDGQSGDKMQGWVVHGESFVHGLAEWYERYELPVGCYIKLERTRDPRVINVDFEARRLKRLWGKVAVAQGNNLVFQVRKLPVSCEYDDQLTIAEDNPRMIDRLWDQAHTRGDSLLQIMLRIMPELIKLSPQATVHAKSIYSAVNVLKRVPPGPIFALLSTEPCFVAMGGGYWTFDETLVGVSGV
ncbi:MAG: hypothetical protein M8467_16530 [Anaerolineae bacterium]|nr:hypothetical protein [Anaerolineae bacterium]